MKPSEMTDEQLRVKVAELLGWRGPFRMGNEHLHGYHDHHRLGGKYEAHVPDYPNDLNACHEMEKALEGKVSQYNNTMSFEYLLALLRIIYPTKTGGLGWEEASQVLMATARQRCEAFVEVMSK